METTVLIKCDDLRKLIQEAVRIELISISQTSIPTEQEPSEGGIDFAQKILRVYSKSTIYKMTSEGTIPYTKRGKTLWFNRVNLEKWLSEGASCQRKK